MADFTDVSVAIVNALAAAIYPNGGPSVLGFDVRLYPGWPDPNTLDADLVAGVAHLNVWPMPHEKMLSSSGSDWEQRTAPNVTLTVAVSGPTITLSGTAGVGQNAILVVDNVAYNYACAANDTPTTVATALRTQLPGKYAATQNGAALTLTGAKNIAARTGSSGIMIRELQRMEKGFSLCLWTELPAKRAALANLALPTLLAAPRLLLPDGSYAIVRYQNAIERDDLQKDNAYRRDLLCTGEYSITQTQTATTVLSTQLNVIQEDSNKTLATINT